MLMKKIRCSIIDDETHSISIITDHILHMPALEIVHTFSSPIEALNGIRSTDHIDLLFLDISMPDISGIELAASLKERVRFIIFTTAHPKYALKAFDLDIRQYLLKPIERVKFTKVISRILDKEIWQAYQQDGFLFVHTKEKRLVKIIKEDVLYFETAGNYVRIVMQAAEVLTYLTMKEVEYDFCFTNFYRVHRKFFVNYDRILDVSGNNIHLGGAHYVLMSAGYKEHVRHFIEKKTLKSGRIA